MRPRCNGRGVCLGAGDELIGNSASVTHVSPVEGVVTMALTKHPAGVEKTLKDRLFQIWKNPEFVGGVLICLQTDEERQHILDAIEAGELPEPGDITLFALNIHLDREERLERENRIHKEREATP